MLPLITFICGGGIFDDFTFRLRHANSLIPPICLINTVRSHARISCPTRISISAILMKFVSSYLVQAKFFLHADSS